jgi:hypothetical protein
LSYRDAECSCDMDLFLSYARQVFTMLRRLYLLMHQALERYLSVLLITIFEQFENFRSASGHFTARGRGCRGSMSVTQS